MARQPRLYMEGCAQHIVQRGVNRQACFFSEQDYAFYLQQLKIAADKNGVSVHAFVLMTNHVHLLVTPHDKSGVSRMMQSLGRCYVRYINITYKRTGTLWEGRFKSSLVDSENYLITVYRYIELNPVRAGIGLVETPTLSPIRCSQNRLERFCTAQLLEGRAVEVGVSASSVSGGCWWHGFEDYGWEVCEWGGYGCDGACVESGEGCTKGERALHEAWGLSEGQW